MTDQGVSMAGEDEEAGLRLRLSLQPDHSGLYEHLLAVPVRRRVKVARDLMMLGVKLERMLQVGLIPDSSVGTSEPVMSTDAMKPHKHRKRRREVIAEPAPAAAVDTELMASLFGPALARLRS